MIDKDTVLVLAAIIGPFVTGVLSFVQSLKNSGKIDNLHGQLNSRLTELLNEVKKTSHAEGLAEGLAQNAKDVLPPGN